MAVASFGIVECESKDGKNRILFTSEHGSKYGPLLPGGRLNEEELRMYYDANQKDPAALRAVIREVADELNCLFVPTNDFLEIRAESFREEKGTAWYWGGKLYERRFLDIAVLSNVGPYTLNGSSGLQMTSKRMIPEINNVVEISQMANENVKPLFMLENDEVLGHVKFPSMRDASRQYLNYRQKN